MKTSNIIFGLTLSLLTVASAAQAQEAAQAESFWCVKTVITTEEGASEIVEVAVDGDVREATELAKESFGTEHTYLGRCSNR